MKELSFKAILVIGMLCSQLSAQISQYNHSPVIVGQQDLHIFKGEILRIDPDSLIVGDLDQSDYSGYQISLKAGNNYSIEGNNIIPGSGFSGILYIPCTINDGTFSSNTFPLEVVVSGNRKNGSSISSVKFFVAKNGKDQNNGTINKPFASLERALKEVRKLKDLNKFPDGGIEILFRKGFYLISETILLDSTVSGKKGSPLIIRSYPGEKVYFEGGSRLDYLSFHPITTPGIKERILDKEAAEKVLELDLSALGIIELGKTTRRGYGIRSNGLPEIALVVNGSLQTIARYPNESYNKQIVKVTDPKYSFITRDKHVALWPKAEDIWLDGSICLPWEWSMNQVESINPVTLEITLKYPEYSKIDSSTAIYHFKNILEEIDKPGEYYIDAENGKLYFLPDSDFSAETSIYLTRLDKPMLEYSEGVTDTWLDGIIFENGRDECMIVRGKRNKIRNCEVRSFGRSGITVSGTNNEIVNSHIHHIGMEGVILNNAQTDDHKLIPSCNVIKNSEINDFSMWHRAYKPGLRIAGVGTGTSHCLIYNGPHMGVTISGNDHVFEYTEVHHTPKEFSDMLSVYIITGSNPQQRGTVIRRNYFHDVNSKWKQGAGVYLDNETYGVAILENFFYNSGGDKEGWSVMVHGGGDNIVRDNVFIDCAFPFLISLRLNTYAKQKFEPYLESWSRKFKENYPFYDTTRCVHLLHYPELAHFFDDDDGKPASELYTFNVKKNENGEIINYWTRRTPSTNVFENNLVYNSVPRSFKLGSEIMGVREIREFYVVNGFRFMDGRLQDNLIHSNNYKWETDPDFVDFKNRDFTIRKNAEVLEKIPVLERIPFQKIGLRSKLQ